MGLGEEAEGETSRSYHFVHNLKGWILACRLHTKRVHGAKWEMLCRVQLGYTTLFFLEEYCEDFWEPKDLLTLVQWRWEELCMTQEVKLFCS